MGGCKLRAVNQAFSTSNVSAAKQVEEECRKKWRDTHVSHSQHVRLYNSSTIVM
jgi:hypothetical protein